MINIISAYVIEGDLYKVYGEDQELHVFDSYVQAIDADDNLYYHHHVFPGHVQSDEGFSYPDREARGAAQKFADLIDNVGRIDPQYWIPAGKRETEGQAMARLEASWAWDPANPGA